MLTGACGDFFDPVGGSFSHQFPPGWVYVPSLLVAGQGRGSRDKPSFQAEEQEGLPSEVLEFGGVGVQGDAWCRLRTPQTPGEV